jgi:hypothetical protein
MKRYLSIVFCLFIIQTAFCQKQKTTPCDTYECIISQVKASLKTTTSKEYQKLLQA